MASEEQQVFPNGDETTIVTSSFLSLPVLLGSVGVVLLLLLVIFAYMYQQRQKQEQAQQEQQRQSKLQTTGKGTSTATAAAAAADDPLAARTIGLEDVAYLAEQLTPDSDFFNVLWAVASTPENILFGIAGYEARQALIAEREKEAREAQASSKKKKSTSASLAFDLDDEGWADDAEDDDEQAKEKAKLAAMAEEEKQKAREQLQKATGKAKVLLEGYDEGVIGQNWVEKTLASKGAWPPKDLGILQNQTFEYDGKELGPLDHPGLRRNICMIMGRMHSVMLNSHPELCKCQENNHHPSTENDMLYFYSCAWCVFRLCFQWKPDRNNWSMNRISREVWNSVIVVPCCWRPHFERQWPAGITS